MPRDRDTTPPLLRAKAYDRPSVFTPGNLLREARRQKSVEEGTVPHVCILDPDGDIVRHLRRTDRATLNSKWACYHTELYDFEHGGLSFGIIGCAVGSSFAVLVAEELFASGCRMLISMTSAGQVLASGDPPYFVLIERALRDEGTSYHYVPPSDYAQLDDALRRRLRDAFVALPEPVHSGATWTTDAPFRETDDAVAAARAAGILAVEMEAAALYAFAAARGRPVVCFAHVTNQMAMVEGDFEKGEADGTRAALQVVEAATRATEDVWQSP